MKKILVTGGSHAELPLIEAAQRMGYFVITTGNNPEGLGHAKANKYVPGDFSDCHFVLELAMKECVCGIVSGCNDFAYISTAYACEQLSLPGHDVYKVAKTVHHKDKFRQAMRNSGIRTPACIFCTSFLQCREGVGTIGFPLLVKPIDLTGGKGIRVCYTIEELKSAFEEAMLQTREKGIILEEFIRGSNHGITTLIKKQRIVWHMIDNEQYQGNKYLVAGASAPSNIAQHTEYQLMNDLERIARNLQLADGLFHCQFIVEANGYPVMIDPCRRAPGDLYILLAKYVTGLDYPMEIVKAELGIPLAEYYPQERNFVARECIMATKTGEIKEIIISEVVKKYIFASLIWGKPGEKIIDPLKYKAGILFMKFSTYEEMQEILEQYNKLVYVGVI